ncbi:hypothetical protein JQC67_00850 [Aurantibacter crassamenti]|nr:hypothetical protein [Aurantibacter crassamenti]
MAMLLLASTVSWTVSKHYCMGRLMDVALFTHAEDCGMQMLNSDSSTPIANEDSCCANDFIIVTGQDELTITFNDLKLDQQYFLVSLVQSYINILYGDTELSVPINHYPPPLLVKNLQLLDEVYLI